MYVTGILTPYCLLLFSIALENPLGNTRADSSLHVAENPIFSPTLLHEIKYGNLSR